MRSSSRLGQGLAKGVTACQRCRRRKQKCDLKHPNCTNCESAHAPCLIYHSGKQAEISRNYVSDLEAQVEKLTRQIHELRTRARANSVNAENATALEVFSPVGHEIGTCPTESPTSSNASSNHVQDLVKSVRDVVVEPSGQPRFLGQSSGVTFAKLLMAVIYVGDLSSPLIPEERLYDHSSSAPAAEASLPPRPVADYLVEVYFQHRTPHLPIVERSQVEEALKSAYVSLSGHQPSDRIIEKDMFTTYMVFAIALYDVPKPSGGRPSQSEGCFRSAICWIEKAVAYSKSELETLRFVLLLAQFVALYPSWGSLWHLTGIALRLCIDIGLHWETEEQTLNMDPKLLHDRRRLWYSTYQFDRALCITLGRPFGIIDESTRVPLPNSFTASRRPLSCESAELDTHNERALNHLFKLSKLESEIRHVAHSQTWTLKMAKPRANYSDWAQDIQLRLQEWYATIPPSRKAHPHSIFAYQVYWDAIYNNAILLLYRPNSKASQASTEASLIVFEASCKVVASIRVLHREAKIDVLWRSVYHLFMAGLRVIYGLWHSKDIRDLNPIQKHVYTLQSCASTLSALSESFPGAAGCRDAFDTLSSATVDWLVTNDAEETRQNRPEFERQVKEILQHLQLSRGGNDNVANEMSAFLSTDNFAIGEMLNSVAQWPNFQDIKFTGISSYPMKV